MKHQRRASWPLYCAILAPQLYSTLDSSIINVALPRIAQDYHLGIETAQFVITAYLISLGSTIMFFSRLADRIAPSRMMAAGWFLCALAAPIGLVGGSIAWPIASRLLQGVGVAILTPTALTVMNREISSSERPRVLGAWSALGSIGFIAGTFLGGILTQWAGWRSIFVACGAIAVICSPSIRSVPTDAKTDQDGLGAQFMQLTMLSLALFLLFSGLGLQSDSKMRGVSIGLVVIGAGALIAFWHRDRTADKPAVFGRSLWTPNFTRQLSLLALQALMLASGLFAALTILYSSELGKSPATVGLCMLPLAVSAAIFGPMAGRIVSRIGVKAGKVGLALGAGGVSLLSLSNAGNYVAVGVLGQSVAGVGFVIALIAPISLLQEMSPAGSEGVTSGLVTTVSQLGGSMGVSLYLFAMAHLPRLSAFWVVPMILIIPSLIIRIRHVR